MSLLPIWARVAGNTVDAYVRQALTMFGANGDAGTPRSTGVTAVRADGVTPIGPAAGPVAPFVVETLEDEPKLAIVALEHGMRVYSEADERIWIGFSPEMTAATAAIFIDPDSQDYFAPSYSAGYGGPVYILAASGAAGKKVRFQPW